MSQQHFDFLIFLGRFQPFHRGHLNIIRLALQQADQVIVVNGSAHQPRSLRNPWQDAEREAMIRVDLSEAENSRVHIAQVADKTYNELAWVNQLQFKVNQLISSLDEDSDNPPKIGLISAGNYLLSEYYAELFPLWEQVELTSAHAESFSGSLIRELLFSVKASHYLNEIAPQHLSAGVIEKLKEFILSPAFTDLVKEKEFILEYRASWHAAPYDPVFVTADAVVVQSGHILMVERNGRPGKGLHALPGGFVDNDEKIQDACLRELLEETQLDVPLAILKNSIDSREVFDDPWRSSRGRTITHALYIELPPAKVLPEVKAADDAKRAFWLPLGELDSTRIFEDHYAIIQTMTGF